MSPGLNYRPAYLGLFAAQALALTCNAFLDIQHGVFLPEVVLWSAAFAWTLRTGWLQQGVADERGTRAMRRWLIFGGIASVLVLIPMWGFPRGGVYMLAMLQVAYNTVTVTRRHLHLGLLISLVLVIFAASHFRADWTMLFYLVPYIAAAVFTLVAEQISRRTVDLRQQSLGKQVIGGQMASIASATVAILSLGLLLYAVTPQITSISMLWKWGNPTDLGIGEGEAQIGRNGRQAGAGGGTGKAQGGSAGAGQSQGGAGNWPTPAQMRQAAARKGMPQWQRSAINRLADMSEWASVTLKPQLQRLIDLWQAFKEWLQQNLDALLRTLILLAALALAAAFWRLLREARVATWLRTRFDYWRLALLGLHGQGKDAERRYFEALERLFLLCEIARSDTENTREYLAQISTFHRRQRSDAGIIVRRFEDHRYGGHTAGEAELQELRLAYRRLFRSLQEIG